MLTKLKKFVKNNNKRPRDLDVLLGHLLVKEYQKCKNLGLWLAVSVIQHVQGRWKSEMHRMTPNWTGRLNSQKYSTGIYTKILPMRNKLWSVSLYDYLFPGYNIYTVGENRKCTEWPQTELEDLTVKSNLCTLNTYPWGPNFGPFHSTNSRFRDTTCTRSAKVPGKSPKCTK